MNISPHLVARYEANEIDLEGDSQAPRWLASKLASGQSFRCPLFCSQELSPEPYDGFLATLKVVVSDGPLNVDMRGSELVISGEPECLARLAPSIEHLANQSKEMVSQSAGHHVHEEYFPDHPYLAPSSIPLVITYQPSRHRGPTGE
jgi:hypothetical protein